MTSIEIAHSLTGAIKQLAAEYDGKQPAPGAPVDDYFIEIGGEFYEAPAEEVSRALVANITGARQALNDAVGCVCLAVGGKGRKIIKGLKGEKAGKPKLKYLLLDKDFINDLKKQVKTPLMNMLLVMISRDASELGRDACASALTAARRKKALDSPPANPAWLMLAATIRAFDALAQGKPVNIPDVLDALQAHGTIFDLCAYILVEAAYALIVKPGAPLIDERLNSCATILYCSTQSVAGLLACCNAPGISVDDDGVHIRFGSDWAGADLSIDEMTYLAKKAQSMAPTPAMAELKGKCISLYNSNGDWDTLARTITEYLDAVRNNL